MTDMCYNQIPVPSDTGRVKSVIHRVAQEILYTGDFEEMRRDELDWMSQIDLAHLVMLHETAILNISVTGPLTRAIMRLQADAFEPLRGKAAPRGTYMLYEGFLIDQLGDDVGGSLQTARSRNDLGATIQRMRHRQALCDLSDTVLELEAALLDQAGAHLDTPFPLFTHYQAAQVTTLAHYMLAITEALQRSHAEIEMQLSRLTVCPLGAGAVAGTGFPINTDLTSSLLGFDVGPNNSIDVIASRDHVQRTLSECATLAITVSRLVHDLQLWTTQDYGLLDVDDTLVGISSMMPQKRNIYLTENVKGKLATAQGCLQTAAMAMHATPFSNSIAVGTEASKHLWPALKDTGDAIRLTSLLVSGLRQVTTRTETRIADGFCAATMLADGLVCHAGLSFRDAHHCVGSVIRQMQLCGQTDLQSGFAELRPDLAPVLERLDLSPVGIIEAQRFGGGPAKVVQARNLDRAQAELSRFKDVIRKKRRMWACAAHNLKIRASITANGSR